MPRPKVPEERRRRVAKACIPCQEGKQKCDGQTPCAKCSARGPVSDCAYSSVERSYGHRRRRQQTSPCRDGIQQSSPAVVSVLPEDPSLLNPQRDGQQPTAKEPRTKEPRTREPAAREPNGLKRPKTLYDTRGRVVYLGDCAAPAFLRNLQELLESEGGVPTEDAGFSKLTAIEEMPLHESESNPEEGLVSFDELRELIDVFFVSSCGILDIVQRQHIDELLRSWRDGELADTGSTAVLFLVIAYAAHTRSAGIADLQRAQYYYHHGRQIALLKLTDEPSLETVQAFILISLYMLGCSQRNGSFLNLGTAISAAKSLGFHREEVNAAFPKSNSHLRTRIWRSLRYHDLFFYAMMGRTPSTMANDAYDCTKEALPLDALPLNAPPLDASGPDSEHQIALIEATRAFSILEKTVTEVDSKTSSPFIPLEKLARELQAATSNIPPSLRSVASTGAPAQRDVIRNAHVACTYYFSMMLLTRPFLVDSTRQRCKRAAAVAATVPQSFESEGGADIMHGALASIDSAIHTIQLVHDLLTADILFNNMVLVIAWVFVASLTICSALVGRLGNFRVNERAARQAEEILKHFSQHSRQGKRYGHILKRLYKAAKDYVEVVEQKERRSRHIVMPELFSLGHGVLDESQREGTQTQGLQNEHNRRLSEEGNVQSYAVAEDAPRINDGYSPHGHQSQLEPLFWGPSGPDGQWLTMDYATITDIIDSFNDRGGASSATDNRSMGESQNGPPITLTADHTNYLWDLSWEEESAQEASAQGVSTFTINGPQRHGA